MFTNIQYHAGIYLSRGYEEFFNFYLGCQEKYLVLKREALNSPAIVLRGGRAWPVDGKQSGI